MQHRGETLLQPAHCWQLAVPWGAVFSSARSAKDTLHSGKGVEGDDDDAADARTVWHSWRLCRVVRTNLLLLLRSNQPAFLHLLS